MKKAISGTSRREIPAPSPEGLPASQHLLTSINGFLSKIRQNLRVEGL